MDYNNCPLQLTTSAPIVILVSWCIYHSDVIQTTFAPSVCDTYVEISSVGKKEPWKHILYSIKPNGVKEDGIS